jgi:hypothetical protein
MDFGVNKELFEKLGYYVNQFETADEARSYLSESIQSVTVGIGGSVTVDQLGLYDLLKENNEVFWHWRVPEGKNANDVRLSALNTDVYISSVNAIAATGEVINIDGAGNRIASMLYGHKKVYLIVGKNKLAPNFFSALYRARNIAAPLNAKRLGAKTPCAVNGDRCFDCQSPGRICRGVSVLWRAPTGSKYEIVFINQDLGY